ncbi:MAG: putative lipid II flippase FtsW [Dehalococcoidia bacterium]
MMSFSRGRTPSTRPDYLITLVVAVLTGAGLVFVYSASFAIGLREFDNVNFFITRQAIGATIGAVAMFVLARLDYRILARWSPLILLAALTGLLMVLTPGIGSNVYGSQRWIQLGPLPPVQPSEFAKLAMVIYIAAWLAAKGDQVKQLSLGVVPFVLMVGLVGGLIMLQPDMGTFLVIVLTTSTMFFVAGAALGHVITLAASGLAGGFLLILVEGYRADRLMAFLKAEEDPDGRGFQILQLLIALGSGGVRGLGIGESRQKFFYIPGAHTDGIFAIVGEELGFIGALIIIALFVTLVFRGLQTALRAQDEFGYLLAVGVTCWIAYQTIINLGGITRSLPLTGIPLPFLSYGNNALIATMAGIGVLLSVSRYSSGRTYLARRRGPAPPLPDRPVGIQHRTRTPS